MQIDHILAAGHTAATTASGSGRTGLAAGVAIGVFILLCLFGPHTWGRSAGRPAINAGGPARAPTGAGPPQPTPARSGP